MRMQIRHARSFQNPTRVHAGVTRDSATLSYVTPVISLPSVCTQREGSESSSGVQRICLQHFCVTRMAPRCEEEHISAANEP